MLSKLPLEVRLQIFDLVLLSAAPADVETDAIRSGSSHSIRVRLQKPDEIFLAGYWRKWPSNENLTRLLRVSKQFNLEATLLLYTTYTFELLDLYREGGGLWCLYHTRRPFLITSPLMNLGIPQQSLIRSVRLVVVMHSPQKSGDPGVQQLQSCRALATVLSGLRSVTLIPLERFFERFQSSSISDFVEDVRIVLSLFKCFPAAQTWIVEYCQPGSAPPIDETVSSAYDGGWWRPVDREVYEEVDRIVKDRNKLGS